MKRFQFLSLIALIAGCAFILQACVNTGGGYRSSEIWQYDPSAAGTAEKKPKPLEGIYASDTVNIPDEIEQNLPPAKVENLATVKVAILVPLSGKNEPLGEAMLNAAQMALFDIGHNSFELIPRDTKGTPSGAREAAKDAVNNGAELVLGPIFASSVRAAKNVTRSAGINMIAFSTDWTLADNSTFIMGFTPFDQVERVLGYAAAKGSQNIGVIAPKTSYGDAILNAYKQFANRMGMNTFEIARFSSSNSLPSVMERFSKWNTRQPSPESGNSKVMPPPYDAIFMPAGGNEARSIANLASQYGMSPNEVTRLGTGLFDDAGLATERALSGALFAAPAPGSRREFEQNYFAVYGRTPPRLTTLGYDATALATVLARTGLQQTGRPYFDANSIRNPNGFSGIDGIFRFRQNGLAERGLAILQYKNGTIRTLEAPPKTFINNSF